MRLRSYRAEPYPSSRNRGQRTTPTAPVRSRSRSPPSGGGDNGDDGEELPPPIGNTQPPVVRTGMIRAFEYYEILRTRTPFILRPPQRGTESSDYVAMVLRTAPDLRDVVYKEDGTLRSWYEAHVYPFQDHTPSSESVRSSDSGDQRGLDERDGRPSPEKAPSTTPAHDRYGPIVKDLNPPLPPSLGCWPNWRSHLDAWVQYYVRQTGSGVPRENYEAACTILGLKIRKSWTSGRARRALNLIQEDTAIRKAEADDNDLEFIPPEPTRNFYGAGLPTFPYFHDPLPTERIRRRHDVPVSHNQYASHPGETPLRRSHLDRFPSPSLYGTRSQRDLTFVGPANFTHVRCPASPPGRRVFHTDSLVLSVAGLAREMPCAWQHNYTSAGAVYLGPSNPHNLAFSVPHDHGDRHRPEQAQLRAAMAAVRLAARFCREPGHLGGVVPQRVRHVVIKTDSAYLVKALLGSAGGAWRPMLLDWFDSKFRDRYRGEKNLWILGQMRTLWGHLLYEMNWLWHYAGVQIDFWHVDPMQNKEAVGLAETRLRPSWADEEPGPHVDDGEEFENKYEALRRYTHHWYIPLERWHCVLMFTEGESAWHKEIVRELKAKKQ